MKTTQIYNNSTIFLAVSLEIIAAIAIVKSSALSWCLVVLKRNNVIAYKKFSKKESINKIRVEKKIVCRLLQQQLA